MNENKTITTKKLFSCCLVFVALFVSMLSTFDYFIDIFMLTSLHVNAFFLFCFGFLGGFWGFFLFVCFGFLWVFFFFFFFLGGGCFVLFSFFFFTKNVIFALFVFICPGWFIVDPQVTYLYFHADVFPWTRRSHYWAIAGVRRIHSATTGPLWLENRWVDVIFFLANKLLNKQSLVRWFETTRRLLVNMTWEWWFGQLLALSELFSILIDKDLVISWSDAFYGVICRLVTLSMVINIRTWSVAWFVEISSALE